MPAASLANGGTASTKANYAESYFGYAGNMHYLLIFAIPGVIWAFFKKKMLTLLLIIPSIVLLIGVILLQVFALRYIYFIAFPLVIYSSLLFSFLYEKFGKLILIAIIAILIIPSNIVYPYTYVNVINPIDHNHAYGDFTTPETNYKNLPINITNELKSNNTILVSFFSSDVEWNIKKPNYIIPFTMDGRGYDEVSYNKTQIINNINTTQVVDIYSGAPIINYNSPPKKPYYITQDSFSYSKLKPDQLADYNNLTKDCSALYSANDLKILKCG